MIASTFVPLLQKNENARVHQQDNDERREDEAFAAKGLAFDSGPTDDKEDLGGQLGR